MTLEIPLTGLDATYIVPGNYVETVFNQGPSSAAAGVREVVFVMPMTSSGTWTAGQLYRVPNEQTVETGGGAGSPIHRGIRKFLQINKNARVWALPHAATTGGTPAAATWTLTLTDAATATGTLSVTVAGELCQYTFASGEAIADIASGMAAVINAKTWLPCTAGSALGVLTLTAKIQGTSQGTGTLGVIRARAEITSGATTSIAVSGAHLGTATAGADGTTTEAAQLATALATIDSTRKYYIVTSSNTATALGNVKTHISTKSDPRRGLRSVAVAGWTGTAAAGQTIATGLNYERIRIWAQPYSEHDCAELAAVGAAILQAGEQLDAARNFNGLSLNVIVLPVYDRSQWIDDDDKQDMLTDGLTPIESTDSGALLVSSVSTRSKNPGGTVADTRSLWSNKVSVADSFADTLLVRYANNYGQKKFEDDERLADGTINPNQRLKRDVVRPSYITGTITQVLDEFDAAGQIQNVQASKDSIRVIKSDVAPQRAQSGLDLHVIDWLGQITTRIAEVSTG